MTETELKEANALKKQIEKFEAAKENNFSIQIDGYSINDADLRPDTQAAIKNILIRELEYLQGEFGKV